MQYTPIGIGGPATSLAYTCFIGPAIALMFVINRIFWRIWLSAGIGHDDRAVLLAMMFLIAQSTFILQACDYGYGFESKVLPSHDVSDALWSFWAFQGFYKNTINTIKIAVLLLYKRTFQAKWFNTTCDVMIALVLCFWATVILLTVFQCTPVSFFWNKSIHGSCINNEFLWKFNAIYNIASDVFILMLPVPAIQLMNFPWQQRAASVAMLLSGLLVVVAAILRFTTLHTSALDQDILAGTLDSTIWTEIEACLAVSCACLPMLRPFLQRCLPTLAPLRRSESTRPFVRAPSPEEGTELTTYGAERRWRVGSEASLGDARAPASMV